MNCPVKTYLNAMKNRQKKPVKRLVIDLKLLKIIIRFEECN